MTPRSTTQRWLPRPEHILATVMLAATCSAVSAEEIVEGATTTADNVVTDGSGNWVGDGAFGARRAFGQPDLFYNFYTQGYVNSANAQMYLSPHPVPPLVGHTFYTYQPFYPHEMMYWHKNRFHRYYDNGRGMNRTSAMYYAPPVRQFICNMYWNKIRIPR